MGAGKSVWTQVRSALTTLLSQDEVIIVDVPAIVVFVFLASRPFNVATSTPVFSLAFAITSFFALSMSDYYRYSSFLARFCPDTLSSILVGRSMYRAFVLQSEATMHLPAAIGWFSPLPPP